MSKKPETVFREKVVAKLKQLPNCAIFSIQQVAIRGTPDLLVCLNGFFVALELKASQKAKVSQLQDYALRKIINAGGIAFIVYPANWEGIFQELLKLAYAEVQLYDNITKQNIAESDIQ